MSAIASLLIPMAVVVDLYESPMQYRAHDCLIDNVVYEARGESPEGKLAVIEVTMERVSRSDYPDTVCGVVHDPAQFSWTNPGAMDFIDPPTEQEILEAAQVVYSYLYNGLPSTPVAGSTHYLNPDKLNTLPNWYYAYDVVGRIDNHVFLKGPDVSRSLATIAYNR